MITNVLFVISIFCCAYYTIDFIANAINSTMHMFPKLGPYIYAASITAIVTHIIDIW